MRATVKPAPALLLLLLAACGTGNPAKDGVPQSGGNATVNAVMPADRPPIDTDAATSPANEAVVPAVLEDPGLAGMTPGRRRAYQRGYRDCSAGRYDPAPHPESYRIGCAAAEDRK